ncbi:HAD family hydrolase [Lacticaseibacillus thailandensis]|uniref:HAD family hydrolase n=1 Tax=Lacticaseibacillus thailandensis TaxID=381741 RepID=UPI0006D0C44A|nr:HAD-IIB family hydrolase [Lacticaseibacillus thailandensis]
MTDIQLIASDMDHTLLEEDGSVPTGLFDRIRALREHGVEFAAVSGRSIATLQGLFAPVRKAVTLVGDNGAVIERGSRRVYTNALPTATQQHLVVHAQRQRAGVPILSGVDAGTSMRGIGATLPSWVTFSTPCAWCPTLNSSSRM